MKFQMNFAKVHFVFCWLKALEVLTCVDFVLLRDVLSEVQTFCREHVLTNGVLEVFVRDETVSVKVKLFE